jgi:RNA-directed DNA polymerase
MALAFTEEGRSEAPRARREGTESFAAKCETESPAGEEQLMEEVCGRENCQQALRRVKANKGSPGSDGMRVEQLPGYLKQHWPAIRERLLSGTYRPQPVRRVEIAKPDGGMRKLGINGRGSPAAKSGGADLGSGVRGRFPGVLVWISARM